MPNDAGARKGASSPGSGDDNGRRNREETAQPADGGPVVQLRMPGGTAGNVLWWGGLATVAAFGVVDWPVAALVAAGTWVAEQQVAQSRRAHRPTA